jgi:hypothetical protein
MGGNRLCRQARDLGLTKTQLQHSSLARMLLHLVAAHFTPVCTARGRRDALCLALRLGQFVELRLDALLLDLFVLDGFLVGYIEADVRQGRFF